MLDENHHQHKDKMKPRKQYALLALPIIATMGLVSCGSDKTQLNDAPVGKIDDSPAFIITNPDQFPNIAIRCYGVNGLYSTTRQGANGIIIVVNDPECGGNDKTSRVVER